MSLVAILWIENKHQKIKKKKNLFQELNYMVINSHALNLADLYGMICVGKFYLTLKFFVRSFEYAE